MQMKGTQCLWFNAPFRLLVVFIYLCCWMPGWIVLVTYMSMPLFYVNRAHLSTHTSAHTHSSFVRLLNGVCVCVHRKYRTDGTCVESRELQDCLVAHTQSIWPHQYSLYISQNQFVIRCRWRHATLSHSVHNNSVVFSCFCLRFCNFCRQIVGVL